MKLAKVIKIDELGEYKIHLAVTYAGDKKPLDAFVKSQQSWWHWNRYKKEGGKDHFNRKYILSFMRFYPEGNDIWLFGGIFAVLKRGADFYEIEACAKGNEFIGRLKIQYHNTAMLMHKKAESLYDDLIVSEILTERYTGETAWDEIEKN